MSRRTASWPNGARVRLTTDRDPTDEVRADKSFNQLPLPWLVGILAVTLVVPGCGGSDRTTTQTLSHLTTPSLGTGRPLHPVRAARERKGKLAPKPVP